MFMTYVMSDIHGEYDKYKKMLEMIKFGDDDTLYVLGDVVDRGPKPVELLLDMMNRANVIPLMGNHDFYALDILKRQCADIKRETANEEYIGSILEELAAWFSEGGESTYKGFMAQPPEVRADILEYMEEFSLCETTDVGDRSFIMVHAGLGNFRKNKKLSEYTTEELIMQRADFDCEYIGGDVYIVTGHTPTLAISGKAEIYHKLNNILIDCGACFNKGRLACLCLDNFEEYYVE